MYAALAYRAIILAISLLLPSAKASFLHVNGCGSPIAKDIFDVLLLAFADERSQSMKVGIVTVDVIAPLARLWGSLGNPGQEKHSRM